MHAGLLGTILWGALGWRGWLSVVFYFVLGSAVTKLGFKYKNDKGIAEARGGKRGPENVWGSAATGALLAMAFQFGLGTDQILLLGFASSFSAKLADTFGSEIGKRWGSKAFLITTFRAVPAGTDGAISLEGTIASAFGSLLMSYIMYLMGILTWGMPVVVVFSVGFVATLFESFIGAILQNRISWLNNEMINFLQTAFAAILGMVILGNQLI